MALEKRQRVRELNQSGSAAIKSIDPYGRHNFFAEQMSEQNGSMDGEMYGSLIRPKYDEEQLLLAIDTVVDELISEPPKELPDVVLRSQYNSLQAQLDAANEENNRLNGIISDLRSKISDLQAQIDGLKSELDASLLRVAVAENSAEAAADKFAQTSLDLQQAIQKSIAEAIERVSLEAQVEGLQAQKEALVNQVSTLEDQVKGKTAEIAAGGEQSASGKWTFRVEPENDITQPPFYFSTALKNKSKTPGLVNGGQIIILNSTEESISYNITYPSSPKMKGPGSVTVASGESKTVKVSFDESWIGGQKPKWKKVFPGIKVYNGKASNYEGDIKISGGGDTVSIRCKVYKQRNGD